MDQYLMISGIVANIVFLALAFWIVFLWFIWPAVEACSMVRWYMAINKKHPGVKPKKSWLHVFLSCYEIFGRRFDATSNRFGRWEGVGKWSIEDEEK